MSGQSPPEQTNGAEKSFSTSEAGTGLSLLDLLLIVARGRTLILYVAGSITLLALTYSLLASKTYRSSAQVVREVEDQGNLGVSGGISALRGLGINLGGMSSGLTADAYPRVAESREVRLGVARDTFYFPDVERRMQYVDHVNREGTWLGTIVSGVWRYTVGLPSRILDLFEESPSSSAIPEVEGRDYPTKEEEEALKALFRSLSVSVSEETGIMTLSVTARNPMLAAELANSFLGHLKNRIRVLRTEKARENLKFIRERFRKAEENLREAERRLAEFTDRNRNITTAELRTERERLQRQVQFASDLYSELQAKVTQAEIDLQRSEPVITVLEEPAPPMSRASPQRTLIVLLGILLGTAFGLFAAFVSAFFRGVESDEEERQKIAEVREKLIPSVVRRRLMDDAGEDASSATPST